MTPAPAPRRPAPLLLALLIVPLLGVLVAGGIALSGAAQPRPTPPPPTPLAVYVPPLPAPAPIVGAPVLDFTLAELDSGEPVRLTDYAGRIVFLNFWATWCEPCTRELPAFAQFSAEQGETGAAVLALNMGEDAATVRAFLNTQAIAGVRVLLDPDASAADLYGVYSIPVTFVIDRDGYVRYPHYGEMTAADLARFMTALKGP